MFDFKYAEFIVPAFAVTGLVFAGLVVSTLSYSRRWRKRYEALAAKDRSAK